MSFKEKSTNGGRFDRINGKHANTPTLYATMWHMLSRESLASIIDKLLGLQVIRGRALSGKTSDAVNHRLTGIQAGLFTLE
jgi:hypothetical protein